MQEMWSVEEAAVRAVMEALNARAAKKRKYTTIMTTMVRLVDKGLLQRRRQGNTDIYTATLTRQQYREARAGQEVSALIADYGDAALAHFARQMAGMDAKRRAQLRRLARK